VNLYWRKGLTDYNKNDENFPEYAIFNPSLKPRPVSTTSEDSSSDNETEGLGGFSIPAAIEEAAETHSPQFKSGSHRSRLGGHYYYVQRPQNSSQARLAKVAAQVQAKEASRANDVRATASAGPTNSGYSSVGTKALAATVG
jgi:hypothetical protein